VGGLIKPKHVAKTMYY